MYDNGLKEYSYVCSHCFNPLNKCDCEQYPKTLIQIDKRMVPIIKKLNDMFYKTEGCCEGHIGKFDKIYIFFVKKYKFKVPYPERFAGDGSYISADIYGSSENAKKRNKRKLLNNLYDWTCKLEKIEKLAKN